MKTKAELLASFKKANSERKIKMAQNAGYSSVSEYKKFLMGPDAPVGGTTKKTKKEKIVPTDMVVAFDTTGSVSQYISSVRRHVTDLIPSLFKSIPDLRLKIVAFGDYADMRSPQNFGDAYQESPFTNDENALIKFVQDAKRTSGGDGDEFYELVIKKITEETPWREGSNRTVLLIADYTPHEVGYRHFNVPGGVNKIDWRVEAEAAAKKGIKFDTLTILPHLSDWYRELSEITGGTSAPFSNSDKATDVLEASVYFAAAGSGSVSAKTFLRSKVASAVASGDTELEGLYKSFVNKLD